MKKPIVTDLNILKQKSEAVRPDEIASILQDLEDSLDINKGIGLSAIQIGIAKNISIIRIGTTKINLVNAYIKEKDNKFRMVGEGCLSLPSLHIDTIRYEKILYVNNGVENIASGILSIAIQHEIRHTQGKTILDDKWRNK